MCDIVTGLAVASFVVGAGSAIAGHNAQAEAAEANREAALRAMQAAWTDINLLETEVQERTAVSVYQATRQARAARSLAEVSAGEAGVGGNSAEAVLADIEGDLGEYAARAQRQGEREVAQLQREKVSGRVVAQQRIAQVPEPNAFATGLRIAGSALGAGRFYLGSQPS